MISTRAATLNEFEHDFNNVPSREVLVAGTKEQAAYRPYTLRRSVVIALVLVLVGLAISIEALLAVSTKQGGLPTPARNVFTGVSPRFLAAFLPTLAVAGLVLVWQSSDRSYRELQPYISLARGDVTAAEGLLANYSGLSPYKTIKNALRFQHYLILVSTATTLLGNFIQPLAGSILQVSQLPQTTNGLFVRTTKTVGLVPDVDSLNAFLAAAGFAEAAVFHHLPDPPFIHRGWSIAEFEVPSAQLNSTLTLNTSAIQTSTNCVAGQTSAITSPGSTIVTLQASSSTGCSASVRFDSQSASTQYGSLPADNCGSSDPRFQPVAFFFFHAANSQSATVFCNPTIKALNVMAKIDLNNNSVIQVDTLGDLATSNNVTGEPLNGQAFNGVVFPPSNDTFVLARAISIGAGVAGSIFRFASQLSGGIQATFDDENGFLSLTEQVYTQHLSLSAKSVYFVDGVSDTAASMTSLVPRLWIDPAPAHILSVIFILVAFSALSIHIVHSRQRRRFYLAATPGSIAHIVSMTAHARFGQKLYPYDDDKTLARKLAGLSFSLDPRTGAIIADRPSYVGEERQITPYDVFSTDSTRTRSSAYTRRGTALSSSRSLLSSQDTSSRVDKATSETKISEEPHSRDADEYLPPTTIELPPLTPMGSSLLEESEETELLSPVRATESDRQNLSFLVQNTSPVDLPLYSEGPNPPTIHGSKR
ncbi:hypothetical protein C8F01DRAFT_1279168 [Mycena amicta]|nr:hypothetical protein C8F01DRAFT_1279168 [Mycena amicta]